MDYHLLDPHDAKDGTQEIELAQTILKAIQGDKDAQVAIGDIYMKGRGSFRQDYNIAMSWYTKAAEQGSSAAQRSIGHLYDYGYGVLQNFPKAMEWYKKAAEQGDATAQINIGDLYYFGRGVQQDYSLAMTWYKKAAEQGNADAQYRIGYLYENGLGVQKAKAMAKICLQSKSNGQASCESSCVVQDVGILQAEAAYNHYSSKIHDSIKPTSVSIDDNKGSALEEDTEAELSLSSTAPLNAADATDKMVDLEEQQKNESYISKEDAATAEKYQHSMEECEAMVTKLNRRHFWRLRCSNRFVEDVLVKAAREDCQGQHHIHSLIIHAEEIFTCKLFTEDGWSEICRTNWRMLPVPSHATLEYLDTFNKGSLEELHTTADAHFQSHHQEHRVFRWIRITIETWYD
ncbi:hypothetical protein FBU30_009858 [Linnemannia zychae]|nr:hypothetical protein FBU30_009858 [Linnemannia zychae]